MGSDASLGSGELGLGSLSGLGVRDVDDQAIVIAGERCAFGKLQVASEDPGANPGRSGQIWQIRAGRADLERAARSGQVSRPRDRAVASVGASGSRGKSVAWKAW